MVKDLIKGIVSIVIYSIVALIFNVFFVRALYMENIQINYLGGFFFEVVTRVLLVVVSYYVAKIISYIIWAKPKKYGSFIAKSLVVIGLTTVCLSGIEAILMKVSQIIEVTVFHDTILQGYDIPALFVYSMMPYKVSYFELHGNVILIVAMVLTSLCYFLPNAMMMVMPIVACRRVNRQRLRGYLTDIKVNSEVGSVWYRVYHRFLTMQKRKRLMYVVGLSFLVMMVAMAVNYYALTGEIYFALIYLTSSLAYVLFWPSGNSGSKIIFDYYNGDTMEMVEGPLDNEEMEVMLLAMNMDNSDINEVVEKCDSDYIPKHVIFHGIMNVVIVFVMTVIFEYIYQIFPIGERTIGILLIDYMTIIMSMFMCGRLAYENKMMIDKYFAVLVCSPIVLRILIQIILL